MNLKPPLAILIAVVVLSLAGILLYGRMEAVEATERAEAAERADGGLSQRDGWGGPEEDRR